MAGAHTHVLGVDIGSCSIKAVELQRTGSTIEMLGRPAVIPTPERSVEGGVIVDSAAVAGALSDVMAAGGFKTKKVIASVGGDSSVVVRITEVPKMAGRELEDAIQWELDRQTPFPIEQTFYDYQPIEPPDADPNAQNMEVLIAVAQEDMINTHVDTIIAAKLVPAAIDVEPLAISRALVDVTGGAFADQTIGVVHIGASSSMILIIRKGLLTFVRVIPTAGATLTQAIQQNFMGDEKLSEQVKRQFADLTEGGDGEGQYGAPVGQEGPEDEIFADEDVDSVFELSDSDAGAAADEQPLGAEAGATQLDVAEPGEADIPPPPEEPASEVLPPPPAGDEEVGEEESAARQIVYEAIAPALVDVATEIRRSIDFYRRQHRNEEVDRIVLSGGSAAIRGLENFIGAETGISTELADPFAYLTVDEQSSPGQYLRDVGPAMVVAVGLALRDMVE